MRPKAWLVGSLTLLPLVALAVQPEARTLESSHSYAFPPSPSAEFALGGCASVAAREEFEETDCLQAVRLALLEGEIDLAQALRELEACGERRSDLRALSLRRYELAADLYAARIAFGDPLLPAEQEHYQTLLAELGRQPHEIPPASVDRLRAQGILPTGFTASDPAPVLARLQRSETLRSAFREVFGARMADDLDAILTRDAQARPSAVVLGGTTILPNLPRPRVGIDPTAAKTGAEPSAAPLPLAVPTAAYSARVQSDLRGLEIARLRFLESAAKVNQQTGSVRSFITNLRSRGKDDSRLPELTEQVEDDTALLLTNLATLETRLGVDPLIRRMAGESAGIALELNRSCQAVAINRQRWIRRAAGIVTGLVGAAGVVVAAGATGTMVGGVVIAAALEATAGAYLVARSERLVAPVVASAARRRALPEEVEERLFRRPRAESDLTGEGEEGSGDEREFEEWFEDLGEAEELAGLAGEGIEEENGESTTQSRRDNALPPILPVEVPEELRELPPFLETRQIQALRAASLPEIEARLDEFLALNDPAGWALLSETDEEMRPVSIEQMIAEATAALALWEADRVLSERFGAFFIQAELESVPPARQGEVLLRAMGRYAHDRDLYQGSVDVEDLRRRVATRLVTHCRAGSPQGDLVLTACTEETALSILIVAALRDAGIDVPLGSLLGIQAYGDRFEAVLYSREHDVVYSLTRGGPREGVVAPIYHPAVFYYSYLVSHGVVPEIDLDAHLLIALPNRAMPPEEVAEQCEDRKSGSVLGRAVEWLGSMVGVRRLDDGCGEADGSGRGGGGAGVDVSVPMPRNPLQRAGGGSGGSGGGGGGGGGGDPLAAAGPTDPAAAGGGSSQGADAGGGADGQGSGGTSADQAGDGQGSGGAAPGDANANTHPDGGAGDRSSGSPDAQDGSGSDDAGSSGSAGGAEASGSGGSGGYGVGNTTLPPGPNLTSLAEETVRMTAEYERSGDLRVMPWRLRSDEGMMTGSATRVLYADNDRALERFGEHDLFITLAPAEVEAQRRMLEADAYPVFQAETQCDAPNLPPRRVFRRAAANDVGFRYVYCDQDEAMVIFREREDALSYAELGPPDRPLYLSRLAVQRLESFERSEELRRVKMFLQDPNILRDFSKDELYDMVRAAADLLVFQNALESALVQSMNELGPSEVRGYYYDMHRQVLQAPLFLEMAEAVYRLNQRLASDPLQSLAWADAQPPLARREFFDLYHVLGKMMEWPDRWATMQQRYGSTPAAPPARDPDAPSFDFLQILSDPTRVQVDWTEERASDPAIQDRLVMAGAERTPELRDTPTNSELLEMQDEIEHERGGTDGLGRTGEGRSIGPEKGQRPIQMLRIRIAPDTGDPDRQSFPDDNQVRPGGTEGRERTQTEESASRQEPMLWVRPHTFIDAVLSTWDVADLDPASAGRVPPILRFNEDLREVFLRDLRSTGVYENRLRSAMEVFTGYGWSRYAEVREAMGGRWTLVRARDTGRFSAAYSGNAPINDEGQIRIPNFFTREGAAIPADLFGPVREHYTNSILGIFDLVSDDRVPEAVPLSTAPVAPGGSAADKREELLGSLEILRRQAQEQ